MSRCARSLLVLLDEVDRKNPGRDRTSDGGLGDAAHAARKSSHNPDQFGVYRARDFDRDGINPDALAEHVQRLGLAGDTRLLGGYVIWNRRIASSVKGWQWHAYTGTNDHTHHVHVSVTDDPAHYDDVRPWGWLTPVHAATNPVPAWFTRPLVRGDRGGDVRQIKHLLGLPVSGPAGNYFTDDLNARVRRLQHSRGWRTNGRIAGRELLVIVKEGKAA